MSFLQSRTSLDLRNWKLTLPISTYKPPDPDEVKQPDLARYRSEFFHPNGTRDGMVFLAHAGGTPTVGSDYARTELREMTARGTKPASWSCRRGSHAMTVRQAVNHLPTARPALVAGQIHGTSAYGMLVRLDDRRLYIRTADGEMGDLDTDYRLGAIFTMRFEVADGRIEVRYNEEPKIAFYRSWDTCYFKAGVYLQSSRARWGDTADSYGQVTIYELAVSHGAGG